MRGQKPRHGYPEAPQTLGEHLIRRRLDLGLSQQEVAEKLGAHKASIYNWESDAFLPDVQFFPAILAFLGYDPRPKPTTLGERIAWTRIRDGLTQEDLGRKLSLQSKTIAVWEKNGVRRPYPRLVRLFEEYVKE